MANPFHWLRSEALLGHAPRHVLDFDPKQIEGDPEELRAARDRVERAGRRSEQIADDLELRCHELAGIEQAGLSGAFRRLIAIGYLALDIERKYQGLESRQWPYLLATHKAVEERWISGTYDLSNCLGALWYAGIFKWPRGRTVGRWVWTNMGIVDPDPALRHYRFTLSTQRFEASVGDDIVLALQEERTQAGDERLTEDEVRQIAMRRLQEVEGAAAAIREIIRGDQLAGSPPRVYGGPNWQRQWIVYLETHSPGRPWVIGASTIMAIDRKTGEVTYYGSAYDEG